MDEFRKLNEKGVDEVLLQNAKAVEKENLQRDLKSASFWAKYLEGVYKEQNDSGEILKNKRSWIY